MFSRREALQVTAAGLGGSALPRSAQAMAPSARMMALLARMTLAEKVGQLTLMNAAFRLPNEVGANTGLPVAQAEERREIEAGRLGGVFNGFGTAWARDLQQAALRSRLAIPLILGADVIHGLNTVFPVPLAEAAAFDPDLAERTARAAAIEASAVGLAWTFAPMVDIGRDQRWGRVVEGAGEDVFLGERLAEARVRGFQGTDLSAPDCVLACAKHFAAYGAAEGGRDYDSSNVSGSVLREVYLPPFRAAIRAGCRSLMSAFNEIDGVPCTGNRWLLTDLLRDQWGFDGFVVSDWNSDLEMVAHGFSPGPRAAAKDAFSAGTDMSMRSNLYRDHLPALVEVGAVSVADIDRSVLRILGLKEALGLFEDPFNRIDPDRETRFAKPAAHAELAREAARKSIVLLRNDDDRLPFDLRRKTVALIGPFAETADYNGSWTLFAGEGPSLAETWRKRLPAGTRLVTSEGAKVDRADEASIAAAVAVARSADAVVMFLGESSKMSGEAGSRADIVLPEAQQRLLAAVQATGKPITVLLQAGRALALTDALAAAPSLVLTWFLGAGGPDAIIDVLTGLSSPSGRLPVSFPRAAGQQPFYYARKPTGRPAHDAASVAYNTGYVDVGNKPLYSFGHGLTFGRIVYGRPSLSRSRIGPTDQVRASVRVTNEGAREAIETVQLYVTRPAGLITKPRLELRGFKKVALAPGVSTEVSFDLGANEAAGVETARGWVVVPGKAQVWLGGSAETATPLDLDIMA